MKKFSGLLLLILVLQGCGGGSSYNPTNPVVPQLTLQGPWMVQLGGENPNWTIEANISQAGSDLSAGAQNVELFSNSPGIGSTCGGTATISGTINNTNSAVTLTLTETGPNGTSVSNISGTAVNASAAHVVTLLQGNVQYPTNPTCGIAVGNNSGNFATTLVGVPVTPISGSFSGTLLSGSQTVVTITQGANNTVTISGNSGGFPVTMSGDIVGSSFNASGTIGGSNVQWIGFGNNSNGNGNPTVNTFLLLDPQGTDLGRLSQ